MLAILGLIPAVLTFLTGLGGTASSISKDIRDLQIAKENTRSNVRLKEIDAEIAHKHDQKDIIVANAGNRLYQILGFVLFLGPALYSFKYYAIDKAFGGLIGCAGPMGQFKAYCAPFRTDGLSTEMAVVMTAAIGLFSLTTVFKSERT
jgi:hypothetical protein